MCVWCVFVVRVRCVHVVRGVCVVCGRTPVYSACNGTSASLHVCCGVWLCERVVCAYGDACVRECPCETVLLSVCVSVMCSPMMAHLVLIVSEGKMKIVPQTNLVSMGQE